jgi:hypothetical protein
VREIRRALGASHGTVCLGVTEPTQKAKGLDI